MSGCHKHAGSLSQHNSSSTTLRSRTSIKNERQSSLLKVKPSDQSKPENSSVNTHALPLRKSAGMPSPEADTSTDKEALAHDPRNSITHWHSSDCLRTISALGDVRNPEAYPPPNMRKSR